LTTGDPQAGQLDGIWKDTVIVERLIPANMPGADFSS